MMSHLNPILVILKKLFLFISGISLSMPPVILVIKKLCKSREPEKLLRHRNPRNPCFLNIRHMALAKFGASEEGH